MVHVATTLNGLGQRRLPLLASGHAGTTRTQEGLAVFSELISGAMTPSRFRRLANRVLAIDRSMNGADFLDVYRFFLERTDDPAQSFEDTRRVFRGAERVARFLFGVERKWMGVATHRIAWLNGEPAIVTEVGGRVFAITAIETDGERIVAFYRVLNPDKLRHVAAAQPARSVADSRATP